jgi:hypothetical protein
VLHVVRDVRAADALTVLEAELVAARDAADLPSTADLPDLDGDLSPTDMRAVFTRAVAVCTVAPGRGPVADRVALQLR